jgi:hypothetical protein
LAGEEEWICVIDLRSSFFKPNPYSCEKKSSLVPGEIIASCSIVCITAMTYYNDKNSKHLLTI